MKRNIEQKIYEWSQKENSLPLFLLGARQIGKTYSVLSFANLHYKNKFIYINFMLNDEYKRNLININDPQEVLNIIGLIAKKNIENDWLLIFDEIQEIPSLKVSLKFFVEQNFKHKIIALGSYLGNTLKTNVAFPVGKVARLEMFPMNFSEFLIASKLEQHIKTIQEALVNFKPISNWLHEILISLVYDFMIIGGMPNVVKTFIETKNMSLVNEIKDNIWKDYLNDITKYIELNKDKIKALSIYENIPRFLAKENKKYKLSNVDSTARYLNYENAITSLLSTKIIYKVNNLSIFKAPIKLNSKESEFKIYYNDCGFLSTKFNINKNILLKDEKNEYATIRGAIAENYVLSELSQKLQHDEITYFSFRDQNNHLYEIDYCVEDDQGNLIPIEVKFGKTFKHRSLNKLSKSNKPKFSIIFSQKNFNFDPIKRIYQIPLYAISFLNIEKGRIKIK